MKKIQPYVMKLRREIGALGLAGIALLLGALVFSSMVVKPLEEKNLSLRQKASGRGAQAPGAGQSADKVAKVYEHLKKEQTPTDWLAALHGIGVATGVHLKSANYRSQKTDGRIVRYEIALPVTGSYGQIRDFLQRSLAEIPVMSVDSMALKREGSAIHAELRLTLHIVES
jgi:Tfp pilus assembly protein PilO